MSKRLVIVGGLYGAGKSTFTKKLNVGTVINPDEIAKKMNARNPMRPNVIFSARRKMNQQVEKCINQGINFSIEYTFVFRQALRKMKRAQKKGYQITLFYVGLGDPKKNIQRVQSRVNKGGHAIPQSVIKLGYPLSLHNFVKATKYADSVIIIDNATAYEKVLEIQNKQTVYKKNNLPDWVKKLSTKIRKINDKPKMVFRNRRFNLRKMKRMRD